MKNHAMSKRELLETIVGNFGSYALPSDGVINQIYMEKSPLIRGRFNFENGQTFGIKREAARALYDLTDEIYTETKKYRKGCTFKDMYDAVFNILMDFFDEVPQEVDVGMVLSKIDAWFCAATASTHLYIPCDIIPYSATPFVIGPISFSHITDFAQSIKKTVPSTFVFEPMYSAMGQHHVSWMAELDIADCLPSRAAEIGDLAVDLALVALQLVLPDEDSQRIARLNARRTPPMKISVSLSNGQISSGSANRQPGRGIAGAVFDEILLGNGFIVASLGKRVDAFLGEQCVLPGLNESWSDAAYWFREGIAEPLDTIAVPKLETAVEVLLGAASSKGSEGRIIQAIKTFYGLQSDQMLGPDFVITVKEFSKGLVRDRSRLLHGTWSTLATDMRVSRSNLTVLAHELLINFSVKLDEYEAAGETKDEIESFLNWVEGRRQAA